MAQRTKLFSGFGVTKRTRAFWQGHTAIEVFKFTVYLTSKFSEQNYCTINWTCIVPIFAAVMYTHPDVIKKYIVTTSFVTYPKSASLPSSYNTETKSYNQAHNVKSLHESMDNSTSK